MKKLIFLICLIFSISALFCLDACAYLDYTHKQAAQEAAYLIEDSGDTSYEELYHPAYLKMMEKGAVDEDYGSVAGNARANRHYYDPDADRPDKGVEYHAWYELWEVQDSLFNTSEDSARAGKKIEVTKPGSGFYPGALDWARNSAGESDFYNWEGALAAYDYISDSREAAYLRLGHVVHLLADMAEPDHAVNYPHPGSDRESSGLMGYERFIEGQGTVFAPEEIERRDTLEAFFDEMARESKKELEASGLSAPLGLKEYLMITEPLPINIAWDPTIEEGTEDAEKHRLLARKLLSHAAEYIAGLLELFYDIVNQPPHVQQVTLSQEGEPKYRGSWTDNLREQSDPQEYGDQKYHYVDSRSLSRYETELRAGKKTDINIEFGASAAYAREKIDKQSVKVAVDNEEIPGEMADDLTWKGSFTPKLNEKDRKKVFQIKIYAKDIHNHYPREGLPTKGYELDSFPGGPARRERAANDWTGYEPGWDDNHSVTVTQKLPPPMVKDISVWSGDTFFVKASWEQDKEAMKNTLEEDPNAEYAGVNSAKTTEGSIRVTFTDQMDAKTVRVRLGEVDIPMDQIDGSTYEGRIPFSRFGKEGVDDIFRFEITAFNLRGEAIDAEPGTFAFLDPRTDEWQLCEEGPDASYPIRIYYQPTGRPVFTGYVYETDPMRNASGSILYNWSPGWNYGWYPAVGNPIANAQVLIGMAYVKVKDKPLFAKLAKLIRTRSAIQKKIDSGARKISRAEFRDYLELYTMQKDCDASTEVVAGSLPGYTTTTDQNGRFRFELDKFLYEDGIIYLKLHVMAFPEAGKPTKYFTYSDRAWFDYTPIFYESVHRYPQAVPGEAFLRTESDLRSAANTLSKSEEDLKTARTGFMDLKAQWGWPEGLEKRRQERALKMQKDLEDRFIKDNGPWSGWSEEVRKDLETKLAAAPDEAKRTWEAEAKDFEDRKKEAIGKGEEAVKQAGENFRAAKQKADSLKDEYRQQLSAAEKERIDVVIGLAPDLNNGVHIYQFGENVSGAEVTPQYKVDFRTTVYLVKQIMDNPGDRREEMEGWYNDPRYGRQKAVTAYKDSENAPSPPYTFVFEKPMNGHRAVYHYERINEGDLSVGPVGTLFDTEFATYFQKTSMYLWGALGLTPVVEVEGYPITDRKRFDELWAQYDKMAEELDGLNQEIITAVRDFYAGKMDVRALGAARTDIYGRTAKLMAARIALLNEFYKINPAFQPENMKKILGRDVVMGVK